MYMYACVGSFEDCCSDYAYSQIYIEYAFLINVYIPFLAYAATPLALRCVRLILACFLSFLLNFIVIYATVFSRVDIAFPARRSRSSLKEYPSCLFLRASSREPVNTYGTPRVREGPRG